ncbi:MAG: hypothetical protein FJ264_13385 [Planctomycetes bacterium]|nr:hypothetical protein [Planctomycetota bacterium]
MKKIVLIIFICFLLAIIGAGITGYIFIGKLTSDRAIKNRIVDAFQSFGDIKIESAHFDFVEGITIDNITLVGKSSGILEHKVFKCPKVIIKYDQKSLLKRELNIVKIIAIKPELTVEKPTSIWSLLDGIKEGIESAKLPAFADILRQGIEIRGLKLHVRENPEIHYPEVKLSGINLSFIPFAGSLENIMARGTINDKHLGNYSLSIELRPYMPYLSIALDSRNTTLNEEFLSRLPYIGKQLWDDYQPKGKVNISCIATFNNKNNLKQMDYDFNINLNSLDVVYRDWSLPLYNLNGILELNNNKLYLEDITGYIKNDTYTSQVDLKGTFNLSGKEKTLVANVPNLFLNKNFLENIPRFGKEVWAKIQPTGLADVAFQYSEGEDTEGSVFLVVNCKDIAINSPDFPFPLSYVNGPIKLCNNIILLKNTGGFAMCNNQSVFMEINGIYDIETERKIFNIDIPNVYIAKDFLEAISDKIAINHELWNILNPHGKVDIGIVFQGFKEAEKNDLNVEVSLKDCEISNDKYKFALWGMEGRLEIDKEQISSKHIDAKCFGGHVEGSLSVKTNTEPYEYAGELIFSRIMLEDLAKKINHNEKQWAGLLGGRVKYWGHGADPKDFFAEGQLNVTNGYLSDIPIILSIFKFLNLRLPQKESFHTAKINFSVKDNTVNIIEGKIFSDTIELAGRGTIGFDGKLDATVVTGLDKGFLSQLPIVGNLFDLVVSGVRKQLTIVEIKGTFLNPEIHPVPFKPFRKSIQNMFEVLPKTENTEDKTTNSDDGYSSDKDMLGIE